MKSPGHKSLATTRTIHPGATSTIQPIKKGSSEYIYTRTFGGVQHEI